MVAAMKQPTDDDVKRHVIEVLETLPPEALREVASFVDYQRYKVSQSEPRETPYRAVKLGGLWTGIQISEEDIAEVRREMWGNFGERDV